MPKKGELPPLQVLLIENEDGWIAQAIQHDISVEADTLEDLLYEFERAVVGHYYLARQRGVEPFAQMPPAPQECVELWKSGYASITQATEFRLVTEAEAIRPRPEYRIATASRRSPTVSAPPS
jgi:hypothetical protein